MEVTAQVTAQVCNICKEPSSAKEIMSRLGLKHWKNFHQRILMPLLEDGLIERTQPNSPRSPTQKYQLTNKGKAILTSLQLAKRLKLTLQIWTIPHGNRIL